MIIAQISDPHMNDHNGDTAQSDASAINLQRAVAHLLQLPARPDVVIVTGDCTNNGHRSEYLRFQSLLQSLSMPVYVVPGNHDDRAQMLELFGAQGSEPLSGFVQYVVDTPHVRLIALDTNVPGRDEGALCEKRLAWLDDRLAEAPTRPTMICMHHPPFLTGLAVTDQIGLVGADAFGAIIARHPQVERIVAGHVHMALTQRFCGTVAMTCPATGHTMLPDLDHQERLSVLMEPPACLLHVWQDATGFVTYTSLIADHGPVVHLHDGTRWLS